ncbi:MAG: hypothetical protein K1V80_03565 [Muribaculaceae bacterium]
MKKKVEYFLNAVFYIIWINELKMYCYFIKIVDYLLFTFTRAIISKARRENIINRHKKISSEYTEYLNNHNNKMIYSLADNSLDVISVFYILSISCIFIAIDAKYFGGPHIFMCCTICIIALLTLYIILYRMIFKRKKYLKYFEQFSKKDKEWHRKWGWITFFFSIAPFILLALNFRLCMLIIEL